MIKSAGCLEENILERNHNGHEALSIKCLHLTQQNLKLHGSVRDLEKQIQLLRALNEQPDLKSPKKVQDLLQDLKNQNASLEKSLLQLTKINDELTGDLLLKNQLIAQNDKQFRDMATSYQNKIFELRYNLQVKQSFVSNIQSKSKSQKEQIYKQPQKMNLKYFGEQSQLRNLLQRYQVQNSTLQFLIKSKNQQMGQLKAKIQNLQKSLKSGQGLQEYHSKRQNTPQSPQTKLMPHQDIKLYQQLIRYDSKYKHFTFYQNKGEAHTQIKSLKLLASYLYSELQKMQEQKLNLRKIISNKDKHLHEAQLAYKHIIMQMQQQKVEVDFYRNNFKELAKVSSQRKIKFYVEDYEESLPLVQQNFSDYKKTIAYWKQEQKSNSSLNTFGANQRRLLCKNMKKQAPKRQKRSSSCITKYNLYTEKPKKSCVDLKLQNSIVNFINQTHDFPSLLSYTVKQEPEMLRTKDEESSLFGEVSIIHRPIDSIQQFLNRERNQFIMAGEI